MSVRREELRLGREEAEFADRAADRMLSAMNMEEFDVLIRQLTPNRVAAMKVLFALYRRLKQLVDLQKNRHIRF